MQILYLPEVWHCGSDGSGAVITDFSGARISDELALKKRRIHYKGRNCTFSEYKAAVKRALKRCVADEKEIPNLISRPDVEAVINSNYEGFLAGLDGCLPRETAESLRVEIE